MTVHRAAAAAAAAALLLFSAVPSAAQPETGTRINSAPGAVQSVPAADAASAIRVLHRYAACFARQRPRPVERMVEMPYGSLEQRDASRAMISPGGEASDCLQVDGARLSFQSHLLAGTVAEHYFRTRYGGNGLAEAAAIPASDPRAAALAPRNGSEELAACIIRSDPAGVSALLQTDPASTGERAAMARLVPHFSPCVPTGVSASFARPATRALLAAGAYRMVSGARRASAAGGAAR